jgi:hypothetical protein
MTVATAWIRIDLLEPVIASVGTATAATAQSLPFLPGGMLWGALVSEAYSGGASHRKILDDHQGTRLRIGDALPTVDGGANLSLPAPRSLHRNKDTGTWVDWAGPEAQRAAGYKQAKIMQIGPGSGLREVHVRMVNTQRTAIHPETLRADDGQFYSLQAIAAGQSFLARLDGDDALVNDAVVALSGERFLGRSRSAEFGKVRIGRAETPPLPPQGMGSAIYMWCLSDIAAHDRHYRPTERPDDPASDGYQGFFGGAIDWSRSFVRHRIYSPYNAHWKARQPERLVIERGSVIVLEDGIPAGLHHFGLYQAQGLGLVLACTRPPLETVAAWTAAAPGQEFRIVDAPKGLLKDGAADLVAFLDAKAGGTAGDAADRADVDALIVEWFSHYAAAEKLVGARCGPKPSQWGAIAQMASGKVWAELKAAADPGREKESMAWQARFDLGSQGTFVTALLHMLGPEDGSPAAEGRVKKVKLLAHGLRRKLVSERFFDGA